MNGETSGSEKRRYRFGVFEADAATGEVWRKGMRVRLHQQPSQVLFLLLARPGELLTREQIARVLWPDGTFVDFDHGVNSAINRLREALGDRAASPRYVETLARRGYRFVAPVEVMDQAAAATAAVQPAAAAAAAAAGEAAPASVEPVGEERAGFSLLAGPEDLPATPPRLARALFLLLQGMYLGFYVGELANLAEVHELLLGLDVPAATFSVTTVSAAVLIPMRVFLVCAVLFGAPAFRAQFLRLWPLLLVADLLWALGPFLLLHHFPFGLALACVAPLVYAPFAQRSLVLMFAGRESQVA